MNNLAIKDKVKVVGVDVPNIHGGFGENKKSMLAKHISEIHEKQMKHVNEIINDNRHRFKDNVDIIDVKNNDEFVVALTDHNIFTKMQISKANNIYLMSERGYAKLIKLFNDDKSWELYDQLLDEYFELRDSNVIPINNTPMAMEDILIQSLLQSKEIRLKQEEQDRKLKQLELQQTQHQDKVIEMTEYISKAPDFKVVEQNINTYARRSGLPHAKVRSMVYKKIEESQGIDIPMRVKNAKKKIQEERVNSKKKPYSESTLSQKVTGTSVIKELKLEKLMIEILMTMTSELNKEEK